MLRITTPQRLTLSGTGLWGIMILMGSKVDKVGSKVDKVAKAKARACIKVKAGREWAKVKARIRIRTKARVKVRSSPQRRLFMRKRRLKR